MGTAYPLESYSAADNTFHKLCFRCKECNLTLNVSSFKAFQGAVYCAKCVPKPSATAVADDFKVKSALNAPKKTAEGLGAVQKGTGDKAVGVSLDSMSVKTATSAPKKKAEGLGAVHKGTGDKAVGVGLDSMSVKSATSAPKRTSEGVPISARNASTANQSGVVGATYEDEPAEEYRQEEEEEQYEEEGYDEEQYQEGGEEYEGEEYDE